jgi:hypothetical protein
MRFDGRGLGDGCACGAGVFCAPTTVAAAEENKINYHSPKPSARYAAATGVPVEKFVWRGLRVEICVTAKTYWGISIVYFAFHSGLRLSANAENPSLQSSVKRMEVAKSSSNLSASSNGIPCVRSMISFV